MCACSKVTVSSRVQCRVCLCVNECVCSACVRYRTGVRACVGRGKGKSNETFLSFYVLPQLLVLFSLLFLPAITRTGSYRVSQNDKSSITASGHDHDDRRRPGGGRGACQTHRRARDLDDVGGR